MDSGQAEQLLEAIEEFIDAKIDHAIREFQADPNDTYMGFSSKAEHARSVLLTHLEMIR